MTIRVKIGAYLLPITFLTVICVELFACSPVQKHWQIYPDPGSASAFKILPSGVLRFNRNLRILSPGSFVPFNIHPDSVKCFHRLLLDVYPVTCESLCRDLENNIRFDKQSFRWC